MSFTKLLKVPMKLFRKEVITFLTVRRYDLGIFSENLRYIAVKPTASISVLRQKVWHLLDLPDYCEELIVLKRGDVEIELSELRRGNDPHRPFVMEVWLPGKQASSTTLPNNMLMGKGDRQSGTATTNVMSEEAGAEDTYYCLAPSVLSEDIAVNKRGPPNNLNYADFKKSEISCQISSTSFFRLNGKRSKDNFTNLLLKIQSDLTTLTNKLTVLENKISV